MATIDDLKHLALHLEDVPDPRSARGCRHRLSDILCIALLGVLAGCDDAESLEVFGEANAKWLGKFLDLEHGVPSQDTFLRMFAAIDPAKFGEVIRRWVDQMRGDAPAGHVAIDGKTLRRSFDRARGAGPIHMVSAWLSDAGLVLGQVKVAAKANEIVAIPELLKLLDLRGCTVTIDAMGCQRAIAAQIVEAGAHYVLAVKDNQPMLREQVEGFFEDAARPSRPLGDVAPVLDTSRDVDAGHGRVEERTCVLARDLTWVDRASEWKGLSAVAKIERVRHLSGKTEPSRETAYYIVSDPTLDAARLNHIVRRHWSIENELHWVLDMTFDEDASRIRTKDAAQNFSTLRAFALSMLKRAPSRKKRESVSVRRKRCGFDTAYLLRVLLTCGEP